MEKSISKDDNGCDDLSPSRNSVESPAKNKPTEKRKSDQNETRDEAKKPKMTFSLKSSIDAKKAGNISIKLGSQKTNEEQPVPVKKASASVAKAFNDDSDSDEEEMPPEAKMRMRNIGRNTPTSAGPNSFGKTRQGFCDVKKVYERDLKKQMDKLSDT